MRRLIEKSPSVVRLDAPRSFFLFAGAGSGKTRSLTEALKVVLEREHANLRIHHQQVGIITYTNAACREIQERLEFSPLIEVSTIHSFVWSQIGRFTEDIRKWLTETLNEDLVKLRHEESKGRAGTRASSKSSKTDGFPGRQIGSAGAGAKVHIQS